MRLFDERADNSFGLLVGYLRPASALTKNDPVVLD